jgi:3'-phosphoadenosine 5'-phosphosulfate sulfotransferase (PAPS reductase)/FAD synthetase
MLELINTAIERGVKIYGSVSGGKDGQAMINSLVKWNMNVTGLIHADLGEAEWHESLPMCEKLSTRYNIPLNVLRRSDGAGLFEHMENRMLKLKERGDAAPFWPSSKSRYCTSDLKRDPIDKFLRNTGNDFIISAEGIRAEESSKRAKKPILEIRKRITSNYYDGMTVEEALMNYKPGFRLALTWYPIFNYTVEDVWNTEGLTTSDLHQARTNYKLTRMVPEWWSFHPAYVYGNDRVSCVFCIMGSKNDLSVGAEHRPELLDKYINLQTRGCSTFTQALDLNELKAPTPHHQ